MTCEGCGHEARNLRVTEDGDLCRLCLGGVSVSLPGLVVRGVNKYKPKMSHNDQMHLKTRYIGKDGRVHSHPRYETKDY